MRRVVGYCRVSTNSVEQLDSFHNQQLFFAEYCGKYDGWELMQIYADEAKSGKTIKKRPQMVAMLAAAKRHEFDVVLVKDVARLCRNAEEFLRTLRELRELNIELIFISYDLTSQSGDDLTLGMLALFAEQETVGTSIRIQYSKWLSAQKGRVPNNVYGYDKSVSDTFNLTIKPREAAVVRQIFEMYTSGNMGTPTIAKRLNEAGTLTKHGKLWEANTVANMLRNAIYTGRVVNGKTKMNYKRDVREKQAPCDWISVENPGLRLVSDELFEQAQAIGVARAEQYKNRGRRRTEKHIFSQLLRCECCGRFFIRTARYSEKRGNYASWRCGTRQQNGVDSCCNSSVFDEVELLSELKVYFANLLKNEREIVSKVFKRIAWEFQESDSDRASVEELTARLKKLNGSISRAQEMCIAEAMSIPEFKEKTKNLKAEADEIQQELSLREKNVTSADLVKDALETAFADIDAALNEDVLTNEVLGVLIKDLAVGENGGVEVMMRPFDLCGLRETVQVSEDRLCSFLLCLISAAHLFASFVGFILKRLGCEAKAKM